MKKLYAALGLAALLLGLVVAALIPTRGVRAAGSGCQFLSNASSSAAFCDTFDQPAGTGNRSGDLNGAVWGVSRFNQDNNPSQGSNVDWYSGMLNLCGTSVAMNAATNENDVRVCDGHVAEAVNDGGNASALGMYIKQPFDIASRTGTVTFDVSNDTQGGHAAWPEVWYTDQPTAIPNQGAAGFTLAPRNGLGINFDATCWVNGPDDGFTVGDVFVAKGYDFSAMDTNVTQTGCVTFGSAANNMMNHIELRISPTAVDVYATDAFPLGGTIPPLQEIATITPVGATTWPLTRGVLWFDDGHYNGDKFNTQGEHTFYWDNIGFDGPILPQDRAYDVLDNQASTGCDTGCSLGWRIMPGDSQTFTTLPVDASALTTATSALLTYTITDGASAPYSLDVSINGHAVTLPYLFGASYVWGPYTAAYSVPLADLVAGPNSITFNAGSDFDISLANIDLIAVGGGGLPSSGTNTPTPGPTVTNTPAPTPTGTLPPSTPTPAPTPTSFPCVAQVNGQMVLGTCTGTFTP